MLPIIFEDNHLIVVDKPAGMQVDRSRYDYPSVEETVHDYLRKNYPWKKQLITGVVHRLDRRVSGVVLLAKTRKALVRMNKQFEHRSVGKYYLALVENEPPEPSGELIHWLIKDDEDRRAKVVAQGYKNGKECRLRYEVTGKSGGRSLVSVELLTGRYHQIRAQLAAIGCPIVGDEKYGSEIKTAEGMICLHAGKLVITHPKTGRKMEMLSAQPVEQEWERWLS